MLSPRLIGVRGASRRLHVSRRLAFGLSAVIALGSIGFVLAVFDMSGSRTDQQTPDIVYAEALVEFPYETPSDVISYADQVSLVTAIAAVEAPDNLPEGEASGGLVTRDVTFRIDQTIWHRPDVTAMKGTFVANRGGWLSRSFNDGPKVTSKFALEGAPWFEVGSQYVMPLAYNHGEWEPIMPFAEFPYIDGRVQPGETQVSPLAKLVGGASLTEVDSVLEGANPDPAASAHMDLPPSERLEAVIADRAKENE
jgi:hypothetical protein